MVGQWDRESRAIGFGHVRTCWHPEIIHVFLASTRKKSYSFNYFLFSILLGLLANWQEEEVENVEDCFVSNERSLKMINESNFYMIGMILT